MKVAVKDIPYKGLVFEKKISCDELGLQEKDFEWKSPFDVKAKIERVGDSIIVRADVRFTFASYCSRCREAVERESTLDFVLDYPVEPGLEYIDLSEDIRQEVILKEPFKILCREDCKGICPVCGTNLNKRKCECIVQEPRNKMQETKTQKTPITKS